MLYNIFWIIASKFLYFLSWLFWACSEMIVFKCGWKCRNSVDDSQVWARWFTSNSTIWKPWIRLSKPPRIYGAWIQLSSMLCHNYFKRKSWKALCILHLQSGSSIFVSSMSANIVPLYIVSCQYTIVLLGEGNGEGHFWFESFIWGRSIL